MSKNVSVKIYCPVCKSEDIEDDSRIMDNGVYGQGYKSWSTQDKYSCNNCGVRFKPTIGNGGLVGNESTQ